MFSNARRNFFFGGQTERESHRERERKQMEDTEMISILYRIMGTEETITPNQGNKTSRERERERERERDIYLINILL